MRGPPNSKKLNSFQHAARILLKQSMLKTGHLSEGRKPTWAQGVGRSNRPAPTNRINEMLDRQIDHLLKQQVVASDGIDQHCAWRLSLVETGGIVILNFICIRRTGPRHLRSSI